jgi:Domain of unknown function (DUF6487)
MITPEPKCPTCQNAMQQGFVVDFAYGEARAADWVEGPPRRSFWGRFVTGGVDVLGQERCEIVAFRCPRCGLLQNYAL